MAALLELLNVKKAYGEHDVLDGLNFKVQRGEFIAIVGKSGCGKSTLLRLIGGLESPSEGKVQLDGNPVSWRSDQIKVMFQDGRLLPWKSVLNNVTLGLKKNEHHKGKELLAKVGLAERAEAYPNVLSGGQKQRVALARALVQEPELLLLDEPLSALDALTRMEMHQLVEALWQEQRFTAILVTHDVEEAVALANRVIIMEDGRISLAQSIHLPYPRERDHPVFVKTVNKIRNHILGKVKEGTKEYTFKSTSV